MYCTKCKEDLKAGNIICKDCLDYFNALERKAKYWKDVADEQDEILFLLEDKISLINKQKKLTIEQLEHSIELLKELMETLKSSQVK